MLVVTANWSIADGTLYGGPPPGSVADFCAAVHRGALRSGFRRDGSYRPVQVVDLVLAGDSFDWLVSGRWTERVRPWHGGRRAAAVLERVVAAAGRRGGRLLASLSRLARTGLPVPPADARWRPLLGANQYVPVRVTLLSGDRDPWLEHVAAANASSRYPVAIGSNWSGGGVVVRHGAECDPLCSTGLPKPTQPEPAAGRPPGCLPLADCSPSLSESLAVDLLARFGGSLGARPDVGRLVAPLVRAMASSQPLDMPLVLADRISRRDGEAIGLSTRRFLVTAWRRAVAGWHREARRVAPRAALEFDGVDHLAARLDRVDESTGVADVDDGRMRVADASPWGAMQEPPGEEGHAPLLTVLGHPPWRLEPVGQASARRRFVCLGPAAARRPGSPRWLGPGRAVDVALIGSTGRPRACSPRAVLMPEGMPDSGDSPGDIRVEPLPWDDVSVVTGEPHGIDGAAGAGPAEGMRRSPAHRIVDAA
ncbi:MAG: hypothetical protein EBZ59_02070 [Planctomycetia bacterium]|nr:hypothetical protein [Planctomycetia bacterium]